MQCVGYGLEPFLRRRNALPIRRYKHIQHTEEISVECDFQSNRNFRLFRYMRNECFHVCSCLLKGVHWAMHEQRIVSATESVVNEYAVSLPGSKKGLQFMPLD